MKHAFLVANLTIFILAGCMTRKVATDFDIDSPFTIHLIQNDRGIEIPIAQQIEIERILKNWLPLMRTASTTYPTHSYKLHVSGTSVDGSKIERIIFVGQNWIGDGLGVSTLADTQSFRLIRIIQDIIANKQLR